MATAADVAKLGRLGPGLRKAAEHVASRGKSTKTTPPTGPLTRRQPRVIGWDEMLLNNAGNARNTRAANANKGIAGKSAEYDPLSSANPGSYAIKAKAATKRSKARISKTQSLVKRRGAAVKAGNAKRATTLTKRITRRERGDN